MKKFVGYFRVSTTKQGERGLGMQAQQEAVQRFVDKQGEMIASFVEVESGAKARRPELLAALALCKKERATLVIAKLDRLSRSVAMIASLMESKVDFVVAEIPEANRLTIHILAAMAEHERDLISQRTKAGLARARANGVKLGSTGTAATAAHARAARQRTVPAWIIDDMKLWRKDGMTLDAIASRLNDRGHKTPRGNLWYASTVSNQIK